MRETLFLLSVFLSLTVLGAPVNKSRFTGVAVEGYDVVAYFTQGKPVEGSKRHELEWNGATWRFASAQHKALFANEPHKYAPQYGGFCAYGVSRGYTVGIDPDAWKIVRGKLYLNYNRDVQAEWSRDIPGHIAKADRNWPRLATK